MAGNTRDSCLPGASHAGLEADDKSPSPPPSTPLLASEPLGAFTPAHETNHCLENTSSSSITILQRTEETDGHVPEEAAAKKKKNRRRRSVTKTRGLKQCIFRGRFGREVSKEFSTAEWISAFEKADPNPRSATAAEAGDPAHDLTSSID